MRKLFSSEPLTGYGTITAVFRIIIGIFMIYHGWEIFAKEIMDMYAGWLVDRHFPVPQFWVYLGKATELTGGILLTLGLLVRIICVPLMINMLFIVFVLGHGKIFYEDQYPFLLFLFFVYFFFAGSGKWSLQKIFFNQKS